MSVAESHHADKKQTKPQKKKKKVLETDILELQ